MKAVIYWDNYEAKQKAEALFDQILANYQFINIKLLKVTKQRHKWSAWFENGDSWQCLAPCECVRGIKANLVYIPYNIYGQMRERAIAMAVAQPYHGVIYY